ncbi:MAG: methyltransferase domain-containing protein [Azospirillum sp.]|nr:methyltransferase domain-containing protein [Azospirillum sp.]
MTNFAAARFNMVEGQIRPNRVTDPGVVAALAAVPREQFVPKAVRGIAYVDEAVPVGNGRYLGEPLVTARLLQGAAITPSDVVLVIGCGTGYSAALLARLAATVVAIESDAELAGHATESLSELGADNVVVYEGDLATGYPAQAPYDVILIDGGVAQVPERLLDQLAEGGRLLAVISPFGGVGSARLYRRVAGTISNRVLFDAASPCLPGFEAKPTFVF